MATTTNTQLLPTNSNHHPSPRQQQQQQHNSPATVMSDYEQTREQRIKDNRERLQKLGIVDLSLQLNSLSSSRRATPRTTPSHRTTPLKTPSLGPTLPPRRSSRLHNAPPVTYVEPKEEKVRKSDIILEVGSKPELYTEEHDKLLGSTEMPWTLFLDGYAKDGSRIYDPVNGKTCHQCRQKTLGQRTHCSQCNLVQGQFCGDCLYMRYGEHVVEAKQNPNWICPPCRGICNCSLCRNKKGWAPTGALYNRVQNLGYKSVAHFLIETKRAPPNADIVSDNQQSTKRVLPFEGMEASDEKTADEKAESSEKSGKKEIDVPEDEGVSVLKTRRGVGRSRKRSKNETGSAGQEESVIASGTVDEPVCEAKTQNNSSPFVDSTVSKIKIPEDTGRPRASPMKANTDAGAVPEDDGVSDMKTPRRGVGRPRKRSKTETVGAGQGSVIEGVTADESVCEAKSPSISSPIMDITVSKIKSPSTSSPNVDSIARRLRSRDRALVSVC